MVLLTFILNNLDKGTIELFENEKVIRINSSNLKVLVRVMKIIRNFYQIKFIHLNE